MSDTWTLYVKGSNTYKEEFTKRGDCPFSHRVLMVCKRKDIPVEVKYVSFRTGDDRDRKFKQLGTTTKKVPVLVHHKASEGLNIIVEDSSAIADYIQEKFPDQDDRPETALEPENKAAHEVGLLLFGKFSAWMREPDGSDKHKQAFENELIKLDQFLAKSPGTFLDGSTLKLPDCNLLPKLHHIIVASKSKKGYTIPDRLENVLKYFEQAKKEDAFILTAPDDKEIEDGWKAKKN